MSKTHAKIGSRLLPGALSKEQKDAAAREAKALKERERRQRIATIDEVAERASITERYADLTTEQRERAVTAAEKKKGLRGKSLADWVLEGKTMQDAIQEGRKDDAVASAAARRESGTRAPRTPKDPEATAFAAKASALAPEVKSKFRPAEAREVLRDFDIDEDDGDLAISRRKDGGVINIEVSRVALEGFAIGGDGDKVIRKKMVDLGSGTKLWGRKLGLYCLALAAERK